MTRLTDKQELFCKEYLVDLNATQAAIRAGYSESTARQMGSENLAKPVIAERIQILFDARAEKVELSSEYVLKGIKDLTEELRYSEDPAKAYKGYEMLGKHLQIFTEKIEMETKVQITEINRKIV